ncbi:MAG: hypothetical protein SVV80_09450 [Planctomycetota bacterium]|nr:hypothetical protein [Planctomycetota bacterium]
MEDEAPEEWKREVMAAHRWRCLGEDAAKNETDRLDAFRAAAGSLTPMQQAVLAQVIGPEICNWALFETISRVCSIIGRGQPDSQGTGHIATVTPERWRRIWAYYLTCRQWLAVAVRPVSGYRALLELCDPQGIIQRHIEQLLGQRDRAKELYVERFCICLEAWLDDLPGQGRPRRLALEAAARSLEEHILAVESPPRVPFDMIRLDDHSILQPCHHKLFRRYDIILSSIGDGKWRKSMPKRGTDGASRADELEPYLDALEHWVGGDESAADHSPASDLYPRLGQPDNFKRFAVALLASLLRAQQITARNKAEKSRAQ